MKTAIFYNDLPTDLKKEIFNAVDNDDRLDSYFELDSNPDINDLLNSLKNIERDLHSHDQIFHFDNEMCWNITTFYRELAHKIKIHDVQV